MNTCDRTSVCLCLFVFECVYVGYVLWELGVAMPSLYLLGIDPALYLRTLDRIARVQKEARKSSDASTKFAWGRAVVVVCISVMCVWRMRIRFNMREQYGSFYQPN